MSKSIKKRIERFTGLLSAKEQFLLGVFIGFVLAVIAIMLVGCGV